MVESVVDTYQISRDRHHHRLDLINAELRGVIDGTLHAVDAGHITAEQALANIREKRAKTAAEIEAAWREFQGGGQ